MTWGFLWLMVALKIPIVALLYLVWWASRPVEEPATGQDDGGLKHPPHPRRPFPRRPRRGPHGDPPLPAPPRTRAVVARARRLDRS